MADGTARSARKVVQTLFGYVLAHFERQFWGYFAHCELAPDLRGRNGEGDSIQAMDPRSRGSAVMVAGTGDDDKLRYPDQILPAMPACDLSVCVRADDEIRLFARSAHAFDGIDGIAFLGAGFQPRHYQPRVAVAGEFHHFAAILVGGAGLIRFMRRMGRGNEPNLIQVKFVGSFARHREVGVMNRVESSSE